MTEDEFLDLIKTKSAKQVLDRLAKIPAKERRAYAKPAMALFKRLDRFWINAESLPDPNVYDGEAVTIAVLATASGSELKKVSFFPNPGKIALEDIVGKLKPDWTQSVVDHFVEDRVFYVSMFRPLWEGGHCKRPNSDAVILEYYSRWAWRSGDFDEDSLLDGDVWRFFEVEGGGEDSLANHDKYLKRGQESWADRLKAYSDEGKLDRQRLLNASLDALDRDFAQYRAGWYSRFHVLMAPTLDEVSTRSDRYLRLLSSSIPPTVSFAMKHVQMLDKAGALDAAALLAALEPALQARAKGTVSAALKLVLSAAKRQPDLEAEAARKAMLAMISEDAGVQGKALDAVERLGVDAVVDDLASYVDLVAPSIRPRVAALSGTSVGPAPEAEFTYARQEAQLVVPMTTAEDALALFLSVLEDPRDPFNVERAVDGLSRFGVALLENTENLSPLKKRAKQMCKNPGESDLRYILALTGWGFCEGDFAAVLAEESGGQGGVRFVNDLSLQEFHFQRNTAVLNRVAQRKALPLISLPSDTSGMLHWKDLSERLDSYRTADVSPDNRDLALALMRLDPDARTARVGPTKNEADRAVAYAMGQDVEVGPTPELWAAAWCARIPNEADKAVAKLFKAPAPNCGVPATMTLDVGRTVNGEYHWIDVDVPVIPSNQAKSRALPALFGASKKRYWDNTCCGFTYSDIAWASLTRPSDPETFFRIALLHQDSWQKLADNHTRAYLEPFFRPGPDVGPLGAGVLAYYMACEDKSVSSLAAEATTAMAAEGRLSVEMFGAALAAFVKVGELPLNRWTKALKSIAEMGGGGFVRDIIVQLLRFTPEETPRDIGGLLELCFELHVAQSVPFDDPAAVACLEGIPGGGKTAKYSKRLLTLRSD